MRKKIAWIGTFLHGILFNTLRCYAVTIKPDVSIKDDQFKSMNMQDVPSLILGTVFWILRIVGVVVLMDGIYKLTAARKDGEADEMNRAIVRCTIAAIFITLPSILQALHLVV